MATLGKYRPKAAQMTGDYDHDADVLYIVIGEPRAAEGEDLPGGIVRRYALDDSSPCGVTIIGYDRNQWHKKPRELAKLIADHLSGDIDQIERLVRDTAGAD